MVTVITKTLKTSGGDYTTLAAAESDTDDNLVTDDEQIDIETESGEFVGAVFSGATTDATRFRRVTFIAGDKHTGTEGTGARFKPATTDHCLTIGEDFTQWIGVGVQSGTAASDECFRMGVAAGDDGNTITVRDCILIANGQTGNQADCFNLSRDTVMFTSNNVCKNFDRTIVEGDSFIDWDSDCDTSYNNRRVYEYFGGTACIINVTGMLHDAEASVNAFGNNANVTITDVDCIFSVSADTDSSTHKTESATFGTATDGSVDVIWTDLTGGSEDLHLVDSVNNDAQDYVSTAQAIDIDFEGDARPTVHDAGFDEFVSSGVTGTSATTIPLTTMAASGVAATTGTSAMTIPITTMSAAGVASTAITGTSATSAPLPTMTSSGTAKHQGTSAMTAPLPTMSASGIASTAITGTSAMSIPITTMAASGLVAFDVTGTSAMTIPISTMAAMGATARLLPRNFFVDIDLNGNRLLNHGEPVETVALDTTLDDSHFVVLVDASGAPRIITLPPVPSITVQYHVKKIDTSGNAVTVAADGSDMIDGSSTQVITAQHDSFNVISQVTDWWII